MVNWKKLSKLKRFGTFRKGCHKKVSESENDNLKLVGIVGNPNVGKSVVFNHLTGARVTVSNYPGTTVDVSRGKAKFGDTEFEIVDTPGMYSLLPITEEEKVARLLLFENIPDVILHVVDAKNLERMLPLSFQLIEANLPVILDINMIDETEAYGIEIDINKLKEELNIPVVATAATTGRGMNTLRKKLVEYVNNRE